MENLKCPTLKFLNFKIWKVDTHQVPKYKVQYLVTSKLKIVIYTCTPEAADIQTTRLL